ncbi:uncharacterized protein [Diadema setosum]|uniref:uncharacterized protein n=1 Tax=Diadema setosum TaxID=31175 RepID=UPI003B3ABDC1
MSWAVGFFVATMAITGWLSEFRYNMYTKHCTPVWTNKGFRIVCVVLNYGITIPSLVFFYAVITFYLRRERLQLEAYEITKSTYTPKSSFPLDRSEALDVDWSSTQCPDRAGPARPASKEVSSIVSTEADHHGNKEDDVPIPLVTSKRKAAWRVRRRCHLQAHSRVARLGAVLVFVNIVCWTPYLLFHANYIRVSEGHWLGVFSMWLGYCNAVLDPLVYSCMNRRVRAELWKLARRMRCCRFRRSVTFNVPK